MIYQDGFFYGTTKNGGTSDFGTVFKFEIGATGATGETGATGATGETGATGIPISPICFPAGTMIYTDQGNIAIDKIIPFVHTINKKVIKAITQNILPDSYLICIHKNSLGSNCPDKKHILVKIIKYYTKEDL